MYLYCVQRSGWYQRSVGRWLIWKLSTFCLSASVVTLITQPPNLLCCSFASLGTCNYTTINRTFILLKVFLPSSLCRLSAICVLIMYHLTSVDRYRHPSVIHSSCVAASPGHAKCTHVRKKPLWAVRMAVPLLCFSCSLVVGIDGTG